MGETIDYEKLFTDLDGTFRSGDATRAAALLAADAIISPLDVPDIPTRHEIERTLMQFFASAHVHEYRLVVHEVESANGTALVKGTYRWRSSLADGTAMNADGRYAAVLKQTKQGWRLHRLIENRLPAQAGSPTGSE
jgi:ketosteroid isomerase-like protein